MNTSNERTAGRWNNTTHQNHVDAARDLLASGGYEMVAIAHALIALVLVQQEALEMQKEQASAPKVARGMGRSGG